MLRDEAETPRLAALSEASRATTEAVSEERFHDAMSSLAAFRPAVDAFFDTVTVNADDPSLRRNRLRLLSRIAMAMSTVADFSKIEG